MDRRPYTMHMKPSDIHYLQDSISKYFDRRSKHHSHTIGQTLDQVLIGHCSVNDIPEMSVLQIPGNGDRWFSADNRRLWVFKQLERLGHLHTIEVRHVYFNSYQHKRKITSANGGISIRIRGDGNPEGMGHTLPDKCYPELQQLLERKRRQNQKSHTVEKASADRTKLRLTNTRQQDVTDGTKRSISKSSYVTEKQHTDRDKTRSPVYLQHENSLETVSQSQPHAFGNYSSRLPVSRPAITKESEALFLQSKSSTDNYADVTFSEDFSGLIITEPPKLRHKKADFSAESMTSRIKVKSQDSSQAIGSNHVSGNIRDSVFDNGRYKGVMVRDSQQTHSNSYKTLNVTVRSVPFHRYTLDNRETTANNQEIRHTSKQKCPERYERGATAMAVLNEDLTSHCRPEPEARESSLMYGIKAKTLRPNEGNWLKKMQYVECVSEEDVETNMRNLLLRQRYSNMTQDTWSTEAHDGSSD